MRWEIDNQNWESLRLRSNTEIIYQRFDMVKLDLKLRALELRKQGMSYSQIKQQLQLSKSTLSVWLRGLPLSVERIRELRGRNEQRIERYRHTMRQKRQSRLDAVYEQELRDLLPLNEKELYLSGLFLYWGEGGKSLPGEVSISNTDPRVIKFALYWLTKVLKVEKDKISVKLHLYSDMDIDEALHYWMDQLGLERGRFRKFYIKPARLSGLSYKGYGHGTCNLLVNSVKIKEKIMMGIKAVADYYGDIIASEKHP